MTKTEVLAEIKDYLKSQTQLTEKELVLLEMAQAVLPPVNPEIEEAILEDIPTEIISIVRGNLSQHLADEIEANEMFEYEDVSLKENLYTVNLDENMHDDGLEVSGQLRLFLEKLRKSFPDAAYFRLVNP